MLRIKTAIAVARKNNWDIFSKKTLGLLEVAFKRGWFYRYAETRSKQKISKKGIEFLAGVEGVIADLKRDFPSLEIAIELVENEDFDAFVAKLRPDAETYLVALHTGAFQNLEKITSARTFLDAVRTQIPVFSTYDDESIKDLGLYFCAHFAIFHEFGHIFRGHINIRQSTSGETLWTESRQREIPVGAKTLTAHVTECDADNFAGRLLVGAAANMSKMAKSNGHFNRAQLAKLDSDFQCLACACASLIFYLFDTNPHQSGNEYPIPPIRLAIAAGVFADQLVDSSFANEMNAKATALKGLKLADAIAKANNWPSQDTDTSSEFDHWRLHYLAEIKDAQEIFKEYSLKPKK